MFTKALLFMAFLLIISLIGCSEDNQSKETIEETTVPIEQLLSDEEKNSLYGELLTYDGEIEAFSHYEKYKDMAFMLIEPATSQVYIYGGDIPGVIDGKYDGTNLEFNRKKYNRKLTPSGSGYEAVKDSKHTEKYKKESWGLNSYPASILKKKCMWIVDRNEYEKRLSDIGRIVEFGRYEQDGNAENGAEPIRWVELSNDGKKCVLLSVYLLEYKEFNNKIVAELTSWESCTLRKFLNNNFFNSAFNDSEVSYMKNNIYGDYVCIPNESEIKTCFDKESIQALPSFYYQDNYFGFAGDTEYEEYWLRRDNANSDFVPVIRPESDSYSTLRSNEPTGVRPIIIVDSNCNLNEVTY